MNLVIIGLLITSRNVTFFSDFQYGFRLSQSIADMTVVSDRIARAFNRSGAPDISKALKRV